ncbi:MAG: S1 RNA-binding domain-containing protein [Limnohabitans sp.]|jgi:small subunit ribosomal protein S1|uniref:S1 RNA-binding domain-containing protein n=1 Tax=Limnohabitans sp. TaxID=1907725 RepID=UPI00391AB067
MSPSMEKALPDTKGAQPLGQALFAQACARQRPSRESTEYRVGQEVKGRVCGVMHYGLFVRLPNGESGLVFQQEVCWPGEDFAYGLGEEVKVLVKAFKPGRGLALSIRATRTTEVFQAFIDSHPVGSVARGYIKSVVDYGLFVMLTPGVYGLLHVSSLPNIYVYGKASIGQPIKVQVVNIERANRRISLELA